MLLIFSLSTWHEIRNRYPNLYVGMALETALAVLYYSIFWFTSKSVQFLGMEGVDYFIFFLSGDLILFLPSQLALAIPRLVKDSVTEGTLEIYLTSPQKVSKIFLLQGLGKLATSFLQWTLTLSFLAILFPIGLSISKLAAILIFSLSTLPLFLALSFAMGLAYALSGRGFSLLDHFMNLGTIFCGVYFPLKVLPPLVQRLSEVVFPYSFIVKWGRDIWLGTQGIQPGVFFLLIAGLILLGGSFLLFDQAFWYLRKTGRSLLATAARL